MNSPSILNVSSGEIAVVLVAAVLVGIVTICFSFSLVEVLGPPQTVGGDRSLGVADELFVAVARVLLCHLPKEVFI